MKKGYDIFIFFFCLLSTKTSIADSTYTPSNQTYTINKQFLATDSTAVPNTWLNLGQFTLGTIESVSLGNLNNPCSSKNALCTGGSISLGYNGKESYIFYLTRTPVTITDDAGDNYMLTVAFPGSPPVLGLSEFNSMGGKSWNVTSTLSGGDYTSPSDTQDAISALGDAQGYCGNINGCEYYQVAYLHTSSGMPSLYLKLPKNLSGRTISFSNEPVLTAKIYIQNQAGKIVESKAAYLYLSGTISVPQRCYISADKSSFDFGTVYSNAANGVLSNMSASVTTDCYYAPDNTQQYLKVEAVSGGALTDNSMIYQIASDSALGIVFNINNSTQCNSTTNNNNVFSTEYLVRTITYQQHQSATDNVNFSLCKYGVPSVTGQKTVILKLTSRWVVN